MALRDVCAQGDTAACPWGGSEALKPGLCQGGRAVPRSGGAGPSPGLGDRFSVNLDGHNVQLLHRRTGKEINTNK